MSAPDLANHRAQIMAFMEYLMRKHAKFGYDRETEAVKAWMQDDWADALEGYPFDEIRKAAQMHAQDKPRVVPNEGDILAQVLKLRRTKALQYMQANPQRDSPTPKRDEPITDAQRDQVRNILSSFGIDQ